VLHSQVQGDVTPTFQVTDPVVSDGVDKIDVTAAYNQFGLTVDIPLISYPQVGGVLDLGFSLHYEPLTSRPIGFSGLELLTKSRGGWYIVETGNRAVGDYGASLSNINPPPTQTFENYGIRVMSPNGIVDYMAFDGTNYDSINATGLSFALSPNITSLSNYYNGAYGTILTPNGINVTTAAPNPTGYNCPGHVQVADINCESPLRTDPNGNSIAFSSSSGWADTAGRHIPLPVSVSTSECPSGPQPVVYALQWNFPGYNGGTYPVLICYTNTDSQGGATLSQYGLYPFVTSLIQSVVLPNNSSWQFTYGQGVSSSPSGTSCNALTGLTYPSGATTSYTYSQGCVWANHPGGGLVIAPELGTRSVNTNDGTGSHQWTYASNEPTTTPSFTSPVINTITDANNNDTVYTMINEVPESSTGTMQGVPGGWVNSEIDSYQGTGSTRALLKSEIRNYISSGYYVLAGYSYPGACPLGTNCNNEYGSNGTYSWYPENGMNVVVQNEQTILAGGLTSETDYTYDTAPICLLPISGTSCAPLTFGRQTSKKEYNFGQGVKGALLRSTSYTYEDQVNSNYLNRHVLNLLQSEQVTNESGATVSSVTYGYDENNGSPQGIFGNRTSTSSWVNTTGGTIKTQKVFNAAGMPVKIVDALGNTTTIAYDSTGAFPHQITYPVTGGAQHIESFSYDANTGLETSYTDQNNQVRQYAYSDTLFRLTSVKSAVNTPAEAWTIYGYPSMTQTNIAQDQVSKGDGKIQRTILYDGFGKPIHTQLASDPTGTIYTDIGYDPLGRKVSQSSPYRSTLDSYGTTLYSYDAIGRLRSQIDSDGASTQYWTYSGNSVAYQDENLNKWSRTYDAQGRLTAVLEPNGLSQTPSMETDYSYDALNNLTSITQWGGAYGSSGAKTRSFSYDSLSRLISSTNPESGTITYSYLANGSLCAGDVTVTCSKTDARGVATSFTYDALNRMLTKAFSNDPACTPSSTNQYDSSAVTNGIGRLSTTWTQSASSSVCHGSTPSSGYWTKRSILAYDPMGRITSEEQFTPYASRGGQPYPMQYAYDLAGHLTLSTSGAAPASSGSPITFTSSYDGSGRLQTLTSSWSNNNAYPLALFSPPSSSQTMPCQNSITGQYAAFGGLANALYGSGLSLNRTYDKRLRTNCEMDTGNIATSPTAGSATVTITGAEQSH